MFSAKSEMDEPKNQIKRQIMLVNQAFDRLWETDKKLTIPLMMGFYFWWRSNAGLLDMAFACAGGAYALSFSPKERSDCAATFKNELKRLFVSYQAYAAGGVQVTHDDVFLNALETLAPFIADTQALLPQGFKEAGIEKISTKFLTILSQPPHQLFLMNILNQQRIAPGFISSITSYFGSSSAPSTQKLSIIPSSTYQQLKASAKMKLYGFQSHEQLTTESNPMLEAVRKVL